MTITYHSNNCGKVVSTYLDHIQIEECDAEEIVLVFRASSAHIKFDVKNLVGIGNNNASVMVGIHNDAYSKL